MSQENIKKGWSDEDTAMLIILVREHTQHKNKWKLVAGGMPDARTPGQVKEKYHRLQKSSDFEALQARVLASVEAYLPHETEPVRHVIKVEEYDGEDSEEDLTLRRLPSEESIAEVLIRSSSSERRRVGKRPFSGGSDDESRSWKEARLDGNTSPDAGSSSHGIKLMRSKKSASGFRGVSRAGSRWEAYIGNGTSGKRYIGRFDTAEEAAYAYAEAFAKLNGRSGVGSGEEEEEEEIEPGQFSSLSSLKACIKCKRGHHTVAYCRNERQHEGANWDECSQVIEAEAMGESFQHEDGNFFGEPKTLFPSNGQGWAGCQWSEQPKSLTSSRREARRASINANQSVVKYRPRAEKREIVLPEGVELIRSPHAASGFQGVSRAGSKWEAYLSGGPGKVGKRYIGRFSTPEEAAAAYAMELCAVKREAGRETGA